MKLYKFRTCVTDPPDQKWPTEGVTYFAVQLPWQSRIEDILLRSEDLAPLVWARVDDPSVKHEERILAVVEEGGRVQHHWVYKTLVKFGFKYKAVYEIPAVYP